HSTLNGVALNQVEAKEIKKILHVIENPKQSIKTFEADGVELAYEFAEEYFAHEAANTVIMIRMPNRQSTATSSVKTELNQTSKTKSNAVVITAIALLPELIAVIKN
ncbi:MAG: hypothetical protein AAF901_12105, partial [Bacteroidota bacterium]